MASSTHPARLHRALGSLVALTALLAACQVQPATGPTPKRSPRGDDGPRSATPGPATSVKPAGGASTGPGGQPDPGATSAPGLPTPAASAAAVLDLLQKPPGASTLLTGAVKLDGSYIVAAGAGNILSHNGGQIVAAGAGNIISHNGGQLVAAGAGNLLSHNGGQLVAAGAGNILSHNGGQIVAAGAGNYSLFQASDAAAAAPVAGVEVAVRSLRTGAYLPVGVDGAGKPVYVVYTNLEGKYDLYIPDAERNNVMIEASVMREKANPRLEYQNLSGVSSVIDEDAAQVSDVLRRSLATRLRSLFRGKNVDEAIEYLLGSGDRKRITSVPGAEAMLKQAFGEIWEVANDAGLTAEQDPDVLYAHAYAATDAMMRTFDMSSVELTQGIYWDGPSENAIEALLQIVKQARRQATAVMKEKPGFIEGTDWFKTVNERAVALGRRTTPWTLERPADLGQLAIEEMLVVDPLLVWDRSRPEAPYQYDFRPPLTAPEDCDYADPDRCTFNLNALKTALKSIGANGVPLDRSPGGQGEGPTRVTAGGWSQVDRLNQAQFNIIMQIMAHALSLPADVKAEVLAPLRAYRPGGAAAAPSPSPSPSP